MSQSSLKQVLQRVDSVLAAAPEKLRFTGEFSALKRLIFAHLLKSSKKEVKKLVLICPSNKEIVEWRNFFLSLPFSLSCHELSLLPYWDLLKLKDCEKLRFRNLAALNFLQDQSLSGVVLTTPSGLLQKVFHAPSFVQNSFSLKKGEDYDPEELFQKLLSLGYRESDYVHEAGFFTFRGGVVDVFSPSQFFPVRLEFLGESLKELSSFDPATQKNTGEADLACFVPCASFSFSEEKKKNLAQKFFSFLGGLGLAEKHKISLTESFRKNPYLFELERVLPSLVDEEYTNSFSLFGKECCFILLESEEVLSESFKSEFENLSSVYEVLSQYNEILSDPKDHFFSLSSLQEALEKKSCLSFSNFSQTLRSLSSQFVASDFSLPIPLNFSGDKPLSKTGFFEVLEKYKIKGVALHIFFETEEALEQGRALFENKGYSVKNERFFLSQGSFERQTPEEAIMFSLASFKGCFYDEGALTLYVDGSLLVRLSPSKAKKRSVSSFFSSDIALGDYVVHEKHGIGQFDGLKEVDVGVGFSDFVKLLYRGGAVLYVPVDKIEVITKYQRSGAGGGKIALDKLGGNSWEVRKKKVSENIQKLAEGLLVSEAQRKLLKSPEFSLWDETYHDFCKDFPFQETADQLKAIEEIEEDLKDRSCMDRLLVGDVGFGKTEVAMRAAMRAVLEGYQVLFFAPTTILCRQHYLRFLSRFNKYGINIDLLTRFQKKETKRITDEFISGKIDILIGTHALLSLKVPTDKVGLVILDEEHKLGVKQKKCLRELSGHTNLLTMTATPLPRTLNMAVLGLKDISLIEEAPTGRLPVKTFFSQMNEAVLKNAISFELKRGGQVLYLHNRIENLPELERRLKQSFPGLLLVTIHGQLSPSEMARRMSLFSEGEAHLLLATTIVESGVDIPQINTLIVSDCERYGLSQLHQIRGRVGRSGRQSYAYFFYESESVLTEAAKNRMKAFLSHESLGAGFHLASSDMLLRGVGNLLGTEQSGDVVSVGIDLYLEMLEESVLRLRDGNSSPKAFMPEIRLKQKVGISRSYVSDEKERLNFYRALLKASSTDAVEEVFGAMRNLYGTPPIEAEGLFYLSLIRLILLQLKVVKFVEIETGLSYEAESFLDQGEWKKLQKTLDSLPVSVVSKKHSSLIRINLKREESSLKLLHRVLLDFSGAL